MEDSIAFCNDVKSRAEKYGRLRDHVNILPGFIPIVGETMQEAQDKFRQMQTFVSDDLALRAISRLAGGIDLWQYPIDGPLPELPESNSAKGRQKMLIDMAREEKLSIRELGQRFAAGSGHRVVAGTAKSIANNMQEWFEAGGADGFTIMFPYVVKPVHDFVNLVIPELQRRGSFRQRNMKGARLRENLTACRFRHAETREAEQAGSCPRGSVLHPGWIDDARSEIARVLFRPELSAGCSDAAHRQMRPAAKARAWRPRTET